MVEPRLNPDVLIVEAVITPPAPDFQPLGYRPLPPSRLEDLCTDLP